MADQFGLLQAVTVNVHLIGRTDGAAKVVIPAGTRGAGGVYSAMMAAGLGTLEEVSAFALHYVGVHPTVHAAVAVPINAGNELEAFGVANIVEGGYVIGVRLTQNAATKRIYLCRLNGGCLSLDYDAQLNVRDFVRRALPTVSESQLSNLQLRLLDREDTSLWAWYFRAKPLLPSSPLPPPGSFIVFSGSTDDAPDHEDDAGSAGQDEFNLGDAIRRVTAAVANVFGDVVKAKKN